jgi:hypothetical protein
VGTGPGPVPAGGGRVNLKEPLTLGSQIYGTRVNLQPSCVFVSSAQTTPPVKVRTINTNKTRKFFFLLLNNAINLFISSFLFQICDSKNYNQLYKAVQEENLLQPSCAAIKQIY